MALLIATTLVQVCRLHQKLGALFRQTTKKVQKSNLLLILTPYVIRDQDDLRGIFERKMQERQEFIDRYFVFDQGSAWEPPTDYSRSNGLVEDIRQAYLVMEEKRRLDELTRPKDLKVHAPGQPLEMPRREWSALLCLVALAGKPVAKQGLIGALSTKAEPATPNSVEVYVSRLRARLEPAGLTIRSIRGFGYMLDAR